MGALHEIQVAVRSFERFEPITGRAPVDRAIALSRSLAERLGDHVVWNINSTGVGGGVAEMLPSLLGYARGGGLDVRWLVISGSPAFFRVTKRLHHALHGERADGSPLDEDARDTYEAALAVNAVELRSRVRAGDVVILHDPQTAGLAPELIAAGALVMWRCHIGDDDVNAETEAGWRFLTPYLDDVPRLVFSRAAYVPERWRDGRAAIVHPSIDVFSAKNAELDATTVLSILIHVGLVEGPLPPACRLGFVRSDGTRGRVDRCADVLRLGRAPPQDAPLVVQVSRWDPLKDMVGVLRGFARLTRRRPDLGAHLVLAGPNVGAVADDPEAPAVFEDVCRAFREEPQAVRDRIHLAMLPTADVDENAAIVNALQRRAAVVAQKSLREGFGLTVTEAMWKGRPVVASAVGGIQDQIEDGVSGLLLRDPRDLDAFAGLLCRALSERELAERLGAAARERVRGGFLGLQHVTRYGELIAELIAQRGANSPPA